MQSHALPVGDVDADLLHQPAGKTLPASRKRTLERAKDELRHQFWRDA